MKIKLNNFYVILLSGLLSFPLLASAETIDLNSTQQITVSNPGFFPFTSASNNIFENEFSQNTNLQATFTNFLGGPCILAPAADFGEIGPPVTINGNGIFILNFNMANPETTNQFGLSFVPQGSPCTFNLFVAPPNTSSSSGDIISGDTITPNGISIFSTFLSDDLAIQLSNENNNPKCENSPSGIDPTIFSSNQTLLNQLYDDLLGRQAGPQRAADLKELTSSAEQNAFTLAIPENKDKAMAVYNEKLTNNTGTTKIYLTGIFPSVSDLSTTMNSTRLSNPEIEVTLKEQTGADLIALGAVQHAIVSATMPWQLSSGNGFFITKGGGCVGPYCTIVESGMVVIVPGGACTPEKLNKRKAGYATFNPSKFFDPFPIAANTIQIPADNIVDPKHPLVSKVVKDNAYLILQPVPPGAMILQQLKFSLNKEED